MNKLGTIRRWLLREPRLDRAPLKEQPNTPYFRYNSSHHLNRNDESGGGRHLRRASPVLWLTLGGVWQAAHTVLARTAVILAILVIAASAFFLLHG
jgi:hypothetical protein